MDAAQRKSEIRRRLTIAQNPRRSESQFADDNDHNPIVLISNTDKIANGKEFAVIEVAEPGD